MKTIVKVRSIVNGKFGSQFELSSTKKGIVAIATQNGSLDKYKVSMYGKGTKKDAVELALYLQKNKN